MSDRPEYPEEIVKVDSSEEDPEYVLATKIAEAIILVEKANLRVGIPDSARVYAEEKFNEWFNDVSSVARFSRDPLFLQDRSEKEINLDSSDLDWTQGIGIDELQKKYNEIVYELEPEFGFNFPTVGAEGIFGELWKKQLADSPLSGHYNRFLPMKISLRVLLNMILTSETYDGNDDYISEREKIFLEEFREKALETAIYAKKYFNKIDLRNQKNIGEKITVGFPDDPKIEKGAIKSHERFVSQFVGSVRNKGNGSLCEMGFIIVNDDGEVEMTREGLYFTLRENPIIDRTPQGLRGVSMSIDEQGNMVNHIKTHLKQEWNLMKVIAEQINDERLNPQQLDKFLEKEYEWTASKSNQVRNGCISRMVEMGQINRKKLGREVIYLLTDWGKRNFILDKGNSSN
ncbi:MAG: hypothetical protein ACJZ4Z_01485 [Candidatus Thalassarchaeaceae archaeon]